MKLSHLIVFMWKEFGERKEDVFQYWLPYLNLIILRFSELYRQQGQNKKENTVDADDMNLDQLRQFFTSRGIPVKEE